jgi:hypothetical protein
MRDIKHWCEYAAFFCRAPVSGRPHVAKGDARGEMNDISYRVECYSRKPSYIIFPSQPSLSSHHHHHPSSSTPSHHQPRQPTTMRSTLLLASLSLLAPSLASDCHGGFGVASNPGDTCESFAKQWKITVDELKRLNPGVTCPDLPYINDTYCVRESEKTTTSDSSESSSSSSSSSIGSTETVLVSTPGASATPTGVSSGSASKTTPAASASGSAAPAQSSAAPSGSSGAEARAVGSYGLVAGVAGVLALL